MTTEPTDLRERIARALDYLHDPWPGGIDGHWEQGRRADAYRMDADAVLPIVREAQAEALRDAAQAIEDSDKALPDLAIATAVRSLRFRADDMIEGDR